VHNLGVVFDSDLLLKAHVSKLTARCYSCICHIKSCQSALTRITTAMVVSSLIVTRLFYVNSLLARCTKQTLDKMHRVLNCSARVIFGGDSRHHVTPLLHDHLHWLHSKSAYWRTRQYTALNHVIWTRCAFQFPLFPTFLVSVLLLVVIWSYAEQGYNSATGHFVWLVRSPVTVFHWTFIRHLHYQRSRHLFLTFLL